MQTHFVCPTLVMAAALWTAPSVARACSCMRPPPPAEAREGADVVFEGRSFRSSRVDDFYVSYDFEVIRSWKGEVGPTLSLRTANNSAACGRAYREGVSYVVYANRNQDGLLTDGLCSRTREVEEATEDLAILGAGTAPGTPPSEAEPGMPTEPPRVEPEAGADPSGAPPPSQPNQKGCAIAVEGRPGAALCLLLLVALGGTRTVRSHLRSRRAFLPVSR